MVQHEQDDVEELEVQTVDPESGAAEATASELSSPAPVEVTEPESALSPSQQRRQHRNRLIAVASVLAAIFAITVVWSSGMLEGEADSEVPTIAPSVLFEQACEEIRKEGGTTLYVADFEVTDEMIPQIGDMEQLETVVFDKGAVTDESLKTIAKLPKLQHLRLRLSPITDDGLKMLAQSESLWYLNLPHSNVTAKGISELKSIRSLRQLRLGSPKLGNEVTREIATLPSLRGIHLIGVPVTDEGLKTLAEMPYLESLYLDDSAVTEAGWDWLFREHPSLHVHVNQEHHDRDPRRHEHH